MQMQQPAKIYAVFPSPFMANSPAQDRSAVCSQHIPPADRSAPKDPANDFFCSQQHPCRLCIIVT
jgi:hypothetical protein